MRHSILGESFRRRGPAFFVLHQPSWVLSPLQKVLNVMMPLRE